jgi:hypothetical protein
VNGKYIFKYNAGGDLVAKIDASSITTNCTMLSIGVNGAGTIAYVSAYNSSAVGFPPPTTVYAWDLSGAASLGAFSSASGHHLHDNSIMSNSNGDVIVAWDKTAAGSGFVRRYSSAGATLNTYSLPGSGNLTPVNVTPGFTDATFWVTYYDDALSTYSGVTVAEVQTSDGAILHSFSPEDGTFEFDGPFCILRVAV